MARFKEKSENNNKEYFNPNNPEREDEEMKKGGKVGNESQPVLLRTTNDIMFSEKIAISLEKAQNELKKHGFKKITDRYKYERWLKTVQGTSLQTCYVTIVPYNDLIMKSGGSIPDLTKPQKGHWLYNSLDWLMDMTRF